jgi:hypothetical protein
MKFLCVPCDTPMTLQTMGPPDRGSLSVVYACPECGYEMAMLTNAYETQVVQSLGVRIGPRLGDGAAAGDAARIGATPTAGCPFAAMMPASAEASAGKPGEAQPLSVQWSAAAEARLTNIPEFVRPMARTGIERFARERGVVEVDEQVLDAAREFFGM